MTTHYRAAWAARTGGKTGKNVPILVDAGGTVLERTRGDGWGFVHAATRANPWR